MKSAIAAAVLALAGCASEHHPDDHFPQASQLIELHGASAVDCHKIVAPSAEHWADTSGWCEWTCVYSGTQLFRSVHVDFVRADTLAAWALVATAWTPIVADSDCAGISR